MAQQSSVVETADPAGLEPLSRLEERIVETVERLRAAQREKAEAEREASRLERLLVDRDRQIQPLTEELEALRAERREITERLENLLTQIDRLG